MISSLQLGWTHRDPCTASWYRDRLTYCHSSFALFFPGWLQRSLCFVHWTVTVHSAQLHVYAWTAEADRWFFSHFCVHKAPGEVSFTYKLCKTRTQGLLAPGGQDSDHVKPPCLLSVIFTSPTSCIWLPACDCCCGILVVSERKEVETHADYRPPSFFGVEVARMCVCACVKALEGVAEKRGGAALRLIQAAHETDDLILFLKHHWRSLCIKWGTQEADRTSLCASCCLCVVTLLKSGLTEMTVA